MSRRTAIPAIDVADYQRWNRPLSPRDIIELRRALALDPTGFARLIGASPTSINRWEGGRFVPHGSHCIIMNQLRERLAAHPA